MVMLTTDNLFYKTVWSYTVRCTQYDRLPQEELSFSLQRIDRQIPAPMNQ